MNSKYFTIKEFKCKCGNCEMPANMPPQKLIDLLENIREHFNKPLIINSGYRCPTHNKKIGGASKSRHIVGDAVDFIIKDVRTKDVMKYVISKYDKEPFGIAISVNTSSEYKGFIHLDVRGYRARWGYNKAGNDFMRELEKELQGA